MGRREDASGAGRARALPPARTPHYAHRTKELRSAARHAIALLLALLLIDRAAESLTSGRTVLWSGLALLLFAVLYPPRVTAAPGRLVCRGLVRARAVRTDLLVSVHVPEGLTRRLVLRDSLGGRVEIDPEVLIANPRLWYRLAEDARLSADRGSLIRGGPALRRLGARIDRETARAVFALSGLDAGADPLPGPSGPGGTRDRTNDAGPEL
ncbi:hypothetical protein ACGFYA_18830 [Streptomyces sp. NPDC048305]|uniref:hypothetical protein n=1 Tax=Streptomyces sp. NPDC048305 TaxID=3365532 RepID=UPI003715CAA6